tara:strand:- start:94 stop:264 length:171 start_codon:yes stop_codon:yes gene_type:complete
VTTSNKTETAKAGKKQINLDDQMKAIENQIAELRGVYNYLKSLSEQGASVSITNND